MARLHLALLRASPAGMSQTEMDDLRGRIGHSG
jgi:hypothetical protein